MHDTRADPDLQVQIFWGFINMDYPVGARDFYAAWRGVVDKRKEEIIGAWNTDLREYTKLVIGSDNSLLLDVAGHIGMRCYNTDYYSTDSIFYADEDLVPGIQENTWWFRGVRIAFEHENNFNSGLFQEISHLLIIDCDLRVLVSYPNQRKESELHYLHQVVAGSRRSSLVSKNESLLIIFGYADPYRWEGYVYHEDGWRLI